MQRSELIDDKIEAAIKGLQPQYRTCLTSTSKVNMLTLADYLKAMRSEVNPSDNYRMNIIKVISGLSRFHNNKTFKAMKTNDVIKFLDRLRKTDDEDPKHKWIGTYNVYNPIITKFFRWLYYPDMSPKDRPKPPVYTRNLKRKETSSYDPSDLWTEEDDRIFLKYCPSKRMKFYHTLSRDISNRPHEVLKLKVGDLQWKLTPDNKQYAEVSLNGKTGKRQVPLFHSIPYVKDYLDHEHPCPLNLKNALFCGLGKRLGRSISRDRLRGIYVEEYQRKYFPKLLQEDIPQEDKNIITQLLRKPWNPYVRRHTGLTQKSKKIPAMMNQYAGWSPNSKMSQKYLHYFSNESSNDLLEAYGYMPFQEKKDILKPKECPNCSEENKPDSKFCAKCRMVLTYDAYNETLEMQQEKESEVKRLQEKYEQDMKSVREDMNQQFNQIMSMIQQNPALAQVKPEALVNKIVD